MEQPKGKQRITLNVDGVRLPMDVLRSQEAPLRHATDAINSAVARYREQYETTTNLGQHDFLAMAALDLGHRAILAEAQLSRDELAPRLSALNVQAEQTLATGLSQLRALEAELEEPLSDEL